MVDEMYLQKASQYQAGEYIGEDEEGNLFKGIMAFMVIESTLFVVQTIPEVTFDGKWLCDKIADNIKNLGNAGFFVFVVSLPITTLQTLMLLHPSRVFSNQIRTFSLNIQLIMVNVRTCSLIPYILLRTFVTFY